MTMREEKGPQHLARFDGSRSGTKISITPSVDAQHAPRPQEVPYSKYKHGND